ncbi:hypothetical protein H0H92_005882 [Tricholoma furcatifolium]|nr:hypothetical protein H0H92_005882 [Tricholoma furcatifolium]
MRGNIAIEPPTRTTVSYEFLSQLVAEYILKHSPGIDISDALSIMPHTQKGLDLNPNLFSTTSFRAATETAGGELKLFTQAGIELVHGWLVDTDSDEARAMQEENTEDYDGAVGLIAEADYIAGGMLVGEGNGTSTEVQQKELTERDQSKLRNALAIRQFLETTQSQMTYHGLFHLSESLPPGSLVALFRASHLSVLYKSGEPVSSDPVPDPNLSNGLTPIPDSEPALYTLVTDSVFLHEPSVVWERIEDVDGSAGIFVDTSFMRASPAGGDWAGRTAEDVARSAAAAAGRAEGVSAEDRMAMQMQIDGMHEQAQRDGGSLSDEELARRLQAEEERLLQEARMRQEESYRRQQQQQQTSSQQRMEDEARQKELQAQARLERERHKKKKKDCIIM